MKRFFKYYLKIGCLILLITRTGVLKAQMDMSRMHHMTSAAGKNIYLLMMDTMMLKMEKIPPFQSPETDFIYQMIPHHNGAISMAEYEISHGKDFEMIQLAKSIVAEQHNEVMQMQIWLKLPGTMIKDVAGYSKEMSATMKNMMDLMPADAALSNIDRAFARVMIPHHQAAIDMAKVLLKYAKQPTLIAYGNLLISNEQIEIGQMKEFLN
jgi:uncharacterized protein (DUF305 family)